MCTGKFTFTLTLLVSGVLFCVSAAVKQICLPLFPLSFSPPNSLLSLFLCHCFPLRLMSHLCVSDMAARYCMRLYSMCTVKVQKGPQRKSLQLNQCTHVGKYYFISYTVLF